MLNSQSVLRNDVTLYCLARYVCFESNFVFFFITLAPGYIDFVVVEIFYLQHIILYIKMS